MTPRLGPTMRVQILHTSAPRFPSSNAIPAPIPREAPVTNGSFPLEGKIEGVRGHRCGAGILRASEDQKEICLALILGENEILI